MNYLYFQQMDNNPARLSYAQMAQRGKERVERDGVEAPNDGEGENQGEKDPETSASNGASAPAALKEQQASSVRSPTRGDDPKEQRQGGGGRRLKENRDRNYYRGGGGYRGYRNDGYYHRDNRDNRDNRENGYRNEFRGGAESRRDRDRDSERPRLGHK